jgi:hypothetical protein
MDREIVEIVEALEACGFRCSRGTEQEARAEGADFVCTEDELPVPLTVEAQGTIDLASALAHRIAFHLLRGDLDKYLAQAEIADGPSACYH